MGKIRGILLLVLLLPVLTVRASAEELGSITVSLTSTEGVVNGGSMTLHYVGTEVPEGYRVVEAFGGGLVLHKDALSPHLAQWLAQNDGEMGWTRYLEPGGRVTFGDLAPGLYMMVQSQSDPDYFPVLPFMLSVPMEGSWDIETQQQVLPILLESPRTGQHPAPYLGAIGMVVSGVGLAVCAGKKRRK